MADTKSNARKLVESITGETFTPGEVPAGFEERSYGVPLKMPGDTVVGVFMGAGEPKKLRKKSVNTYNVKSENGGIINVLAAAQIDTFLSSVKVGDQVWIQRGGQVEGGKGRVNTYRFAAKPSGK